MKGQKTSKQQFILQQVEFSLLLDLSFLLNLKVKVILNCANFISQKRFYMISASVFLTFVYLELLYQMNGLSLYVEKLI